MPRRTDLRTILVLGAGPTVMGQGSELDWAVDEALLTLRAEGYDTIVVDSNPATVATDPDRASRTYLEPLDARALSAILEKERPSAVLPTLGGKAAIGLAIELADDGVFERLGIETLGTRFDVCRKLADRTFFEAELTRIGLSCPRSRVIRSVSDATSAAPELGWPVLVRSASVVDSHVVGVARTNDELASLVALALRDGPTSTTLLEESLLGWRACEVEVLGDREGEVLVACALESLEPLGVHRGDTITVTPTMTLTASELVRVRTAAKDVMKAFRLEGTGANVQFAIRASDGAMRVVAVTPRVSRSTALASKATGCSLVALTTKLALGYTLGELREDVAELLDEDDAHKRPVVVCWPRFEFDKFPGSEPKLDTQRKSVGSTMAIGLSFCEALQKAVRGLDTGLAGLDPMDPRTPSELLERLAEPSEHRVRLAADALRAHASVEQVASASGIHPWFLAQIVRIVEAEGRVLGHPRILENAEDLRALKSLGFSDARLGKLAGTTERAVRTLRAESGVKPGFANIRSRSKEPRGARFATWEATERPRVSTRKSVLVLGAGPNRIGQGSEADHSCVHAVEAVRELGFDAIVIDSNPDSVSTGFAVADRLYFEAVTLETVLDVCDAEAPEGVLVHVGGQTPLGIAKALEGHGIRIFGTSADAIDRAEDRGRFDGILDKLSLLRPKHTLVRTLAEAREAVERLGFPVLLRPSYVFGGQAMKVVSTAEELERHVGRIIDGATNREPRSILVDTFLEDAIEADVDCLSDGKRVVIGGVTEHLERAGVHSGDSAALLPPANFRGDLLAAIEETARVLALEVGIVGLMNAQLAIKGSDIYVLEVNPRASRTLPFVTKATGVPLARIGTKLMLGATLDELAINERHVMRHVAVKECVFPFRKLPGTDTVLGPEMRSTGEIMALADSPARAYGKALRAIGAAIPLPRDDRRGLFLRVSAHDRARAVEAARRLRARGYDVVASGAVRAALSAARIPHVDLGEDATVASKMLETNRIALAIVTASGDEETRETAVLRRTALARNVTCFTTTSLALMGVAALEEDPSQSRADVRSLQEWYDESRS